MITSRDAVNPQATVTIEAIDRDGHTVDKHVAYGKHEPALQLLDFMMNCEALFGKAGDKIVRFTAEIAYIVAVCFFLSSTCVTRVEASHGRVSEIVSDFSVSLYTGSSGRDLHHNRIPTPPVRSPFTKQNAPIEYLGPWTLAQSQMDKMLDECRIRLAEVMKQPAEVTPWYQHLKWWYFVFAFLGVFVILGIAYDVITIPNWKRV